MKKFILLSFLFLSFSVYSQITVSPKGKLMNGFARNYYNVKFVGSGGGNIYTVEYLSGTLPPGLVVGNMSISGIIESNSVETYIFVIKVTSTSGSSVNIIDTINIDRKKISISEIANTSWYPGSPETYNAVFSIFPAPFIPFPVEKLSFFVQTQSIPAGGYYQFSTVIPGTTLSSAVSVSVSTTNSTTFFRVEEFSAPPNYFYRFYPQVNTGTFALYINLLVYK